VLRNIFDASGGAGVGTPEVPGGTHLTGSYPNPFNPSTTISYSMEESGPLSINVYDINGRLQRVLWDDTQIFGAHILEWNGCNDRGERLASGVYFLRFKAGNVIEEEKLVLLK
jgi:flagellar hook assembly protein FlgD